MADADATPKTRLTRCEEFGYKILRAAEVWTVLVLLGAICTAAIGTGIWMAFCPVHRLPLTLEDINKNWKAVLVLSIPVFYRTIRSVLARMKKFPLGMELQEPEEELKAKTPPRSASAEED